MINLSSDRRDSSGTSFRLNTASRCYIVCRIMCQELVPRISNNQPSSINRKSLINFAFLISFALRKWITAETNRDVEEDLRASEMERVELLAIIRVRLIRRLLKLHLQLLGHATQLQDAEILIGDLVQAKCPCDIHPRLDLL